MPRVKANDVELYYEEYGSGSEPIVLVHGVTQSRAHWHGLIECLPLDGVHAYAFDVRGHGRSDAPASGYAMSQLADDIVAATEALGIESFNYAGHSMGGQIGMALALRHSERLRRLMLVASGPSEGLRAFDPFLREAARGSDRRRR